MARMALVDGAQEHIVAPEAELLEPEAVLVEEQRMRVVVTQRAPVPMRPARVARLRLGNPLGVVVLARRGPHPRAGSSRPPRVDDVVALLCFHIEARNLLWGSCRSQSITTVHRPRLWAKPAVIAACCPKFRLSRKPLTE